MLLAVIPENNQTPPHPRTIPASLRARSDREAIFEDIAVYRDMTVAERSRVLSELCALAVRQLDSSTNPKVAWAREEPRSPESLALWKRLMRESRSRGR